MKGRNTVIAEDCRECRDTAETASCENKEKVLFPQVCHALHYTF
ncbi:MAG: hypothetical protein U9N35_02445 [Euryarchaeota archaeon]|nr:hypothetical protein [Euryarchaeota archaeon]